MNIAILGTGGVGQTIAAKLSELGHQVSVGTRNTAATLAKSGPDGMGAPAYKDWAATHPKVKLVTFAEAAKGAELVINAVSGFGVLDALKAAGDKNLEGKVLIDISNPLDFSKGMPPSLFVVNTDSLAERIQAAFPKTRVVKTLNTVAAPLMVNPGQLAGGNHTMFVSGNDAAAKAEVSQHLKQWFGWKDVVDLGDITTARGTEMHLALWVRAWGAVQTPIFAFQLVR